MLNQHRFADVPMEPVPEPLQPLVARGMAKDPRYRPADAAALAAELRSAAVGAYGPDWEARGRSHLGQAALLLAVLWPSAATPALGGTTAEQVPLRQVLRETRNRRPSPDARSRQVSRAVQHRRHLWHVRHLEHLGHEKYLRHLRNAAVVTTGAAVVAAAVTVAATSASHPPGNPGPPGAAAHPAVAAYPVSLTTTSPTPATPSARATSRPARTSPGGPPSSALGSGGEVSVSLGQRETGTAGSGCLGANCYNFTVQASDFGLGEGSWKLTYTCSDPSGATVGPTSQTLSGSTYTDPDGNAYPFGTICLYPLDGNTVTITVSNGKYQSSGSYKT